MNLIQRRWRAHVERTLEQRRSPHQRADLGAGSAFARETRRPSWEDSIETMRTRLMEADPRTM